MNKRYPFDMVITEGSHINLLASFTIGENETLRMFCLHTEYSNSD